jgi:protein ImuA
MTDAAAPLDLARLRAHVRAMEAGARPVIQRPFGVAAVDRHLGGGLPPAHLHEVAGDPGPVTLVALHLARRLADPRRAAAPIVWITAADDLAPAGLAAAGLAPERLLLVAAGRVEERLWALEEVLRTPGIAAAVAETPAPSLIAARRLQLAAEAGGVTALLAQTGPPQPGGLSIAASRWRATAAPSAPHPHDPDAPGRARVRLDLARARLAPPASWTLEIDDAGRFTDATPHSVPGLPPAVDRPARAA